MLEKIERTPGGSGERVGSHHGIDSGKGFVCSSLMSSSPGAPTKWRLGLLHKILLTLLSVLVPVIAQETQPLGGHVSFVTYNLSKPQLIEIPLEARQVSTVQDGTYGIFLFFEAQKVESEFLVGGKSSNTQSPEDLAVRELGIAYSNMSLVMVITKESPVWADITASKKIHVRLIAKGLIAEEAPTLRFAAVHSSYLELEEGKHHLLRIRNTRSLDLRVDMAKTGRLLDSNLDLTQTTTTTSSC